MQMCVLISKQKYIAYVFGIEMFGEDYVIIHFRILLIVCYDYHLISQFVQFKMVTIHI